jgi:hypothetical protein
MTSLSFGITSSGIWFWSVGSRKRDDGRSSIDEMYKHSSGNTRYMIRLCQRGLLHVLAVVDQISTLKKSMLIYDWGRYHRCMCVFSS